MVSLSSSIIFYVTQEYFMFSPNPPSCVQEERNLCRKTSVISDLNIQSVQTIMNYEVRHLMWSVWNNKFLHQSVRVWVLKKLWTFITDRSLKIMSISSWIIAILDLFQITVLVLLKWQRKKIIVKLDWIMTRFWNTLDSLACSRGRSSSGYHLCQQQQGWLW